MKIPIIALLLISGLTLQRKPDFTGTWTRNPEKSELSQGLSINSIPTEVIIHQTDTRFEITRHSKTGSGEEHQYTEVLHFDTTQSTTSISPTLIKRAKASWTENNSQVYEESIYTDPQGNLVQTGKEILSLSADGKTLTIKAAIEKNGNQYQMIEVFDRK